MLDKLTHPGVDAVQLDPVRVGSLSTAQIDAFRRHPGTFNEMVQAIFDAGYAAGRFAMSHE